MLPLCLVKLPFFTNPDEAAFAFYLNTTSKLKHLNGIGITCDTLTVEDYTDVGRTHCSTGYIAKAAANSVKAGCGRYRFQPYCMLKRL